MQGELDTKKVIQWYVTIAMLVSDLHAQGKLSPQQESIYKTTSQSIRDELGKVVNPKVAPCLVGDGEWPDDESDWWQIPWIESLK